jgi:hypothetical protein
MVKMSNICALNDLYRHKIYRIELIFTCQKTPLRRKNGGLKKNIKKNTANYLTKQKKDIILHSNSATK